MSTSLKTFSKRSGRTALALRLMTYLSETLLSLSYHFITVIFISNFQSKKSRIFDRRVDLYKVEVNNERIN